LVSLGIDFKLNGDMENSLMMFLLAAKMGVPYAMYEVGCCYAHGVGITKDDETAIHYLLCAFSSGIDEAKNVLMELEHGTC